MGNQITSLRGVSLIPHIDSIDMLNLAHNFIIDPYLDTYDVRAPFTTKFTRIDKLNLSYNQLRRLPNSFFNGLVNLTILWMSNNQLNHIPNISQLPKLRQLTLNHNQISAIEVDDFTNAPSLEILNLSYNEIERIEPHSFDHLTNLMVLKLDINYSTHSDVEITDLIPLVKLKTLTIDDRMISPETEIELRAWLGKGLKVERDVLNR